MVPECTRESIPRRSEHRYSIHAEADPPPAAMPVFEVQSGDLSASWWVFPPPRLPRASGPAVAPSWSRSFRWNPARSSTPLMINVETRPAISARDSVGQRNQFFRAMRYKSDRTFSLHEFFETCLLRRSPTTGFPISTPRSPGPAPTVVRVELDNLFPPSSLSDRDNDADATAAQVRGRVTCPRHLCDLKRP